MGRGVESALMNYIKSETLGVGGASALEAEFIPTKRNKPVVAFFEQQGFAVVEEREGGGKRYRLEAEDSELDADDCPSDS